MTAAAVIAPEITRWRAALFARLKSCETEFYQLDPIERDLITSMTEAPAIANQIYLALERLGADPELLSVIGSWGDTLSDEEVLQYLKDWNETGKVIHAPQ